VKCPKCNVRLISVGGERGYCEGDECDDRIRKCPACNQEFATEERFKKSDWVCNW
jgi:transcriptional regulator NrdR family protein